MKKGLIPAILAVIGLLFGGVASAASNDQYTVHSGDTMWKISQKQGVSLQELIAVNPQISNPTWIEPNMKINLASNPKSSQKNQANAVIASGMTQLGVPYVFGGSTPYQALDCSGFVQFAFGKQGIELPHSASMMSDLGTPVARNNLRKGDLIFLEGTYQQGVSHVAIYLGNNKILHASTSGSREVKISNLFGSPYYDAHYWGARRIIN